LSRRLVWLSGLLPYRLVSEVLERVGHRLIPQASVWRQTQRYGEQLRVYQQQRQERVSVERVAWPWPGQGHLPPKGISMDGGMMHIRGEGWKEFKVGTIFDLALRQERDPVTKDWVERPHAQQIDYVAVLGSAQEFRPALWAVAVQRQVPLATESTVIADGAEWIWQLAADLFPLSAQVVDWYHACSHLSEAAAALSPGQPEEARLWEKKRRDNLYRGEIHQITLRLERAGLEKHAHYFYTHQRRMQYQTFQEQGYPIGSGTVESGIKQYKARLTGAGMRWCRPNAQRMLVIRSAALSNSFDTLWDAALSPVPQA
jgi:hypothetical protein